MFISIAASLNPKSRPLTYKKSSRIIVGQPRCRNYRERRRRRRSNVTFIVSKRAHATKIEARCAILLRQSGDVCRNLRPVGFWLYVKLMRSLVKAERGKFGFSPQF